MDYNILDENLEKMQPYFKKWFRESNIMLLDSNLKSINHEVQVCAAFNPKNAICQQYMYSIYNAFYELVKTYCYSISAYSIEKELKEKGEAEWSNYWKYEVKNYYFRSIIPRCFSILDYIAVMIDELSGRILITNIHDVDFERIKDALLKVKDKYKVGWLTEKDIKEVNEILEYVYADVTEKEKEILRPYRNEETHRYLVGIDELTVSIQRRKLTEGDKELFKTKSGYVYSIKSKPEYEFAELNAIVEKLIKNLDLVISKLSEIDIMKDVLTINEIE